MKRSIRRAAKRSMNSPIGWLRRRIFLSGATLFTVALVALPALAQESSGDVSGTPGTIYRWLNFAIIVGAFIFVAKKLGPFIHRRAGAISGNIREAAEARARAEREFAEASEGLAHLAAEVEELRRAAARESAEERQRIQALARSEAERVAKAAEAEIAAAERAGRQELRAIAARLATERAAALLRQQANAQVQAMIFRSFVGELARSES